MVEFILGISLCIVGIGGIPVDDLEPYWGKGYVDHDLLGDWEQIEASEPRIISYRIEGGNLLRVSRSDLTRPGGIEDDPYPCRVFRIGDRLLMLVDFRSYFIKMLEAECGRSSQRDAESEEVALTDDSSCTTLESLRYEPIYGRLESYEIDGDLLIKRLIDRSVLVQRAMGMDIYNGQDPYAHGSGARYQLVTHPDSFKVDISELEDHGFDLLRSLVEDDSLWIATEQYRRLELKD